MNPFKTTTLCLLIIWCPINPGCQLSTNMTKESKIKNRLNAIAQADVFNQIKNNALINLDTISPNNPEDLINIAKRIRNPVVALRFYNKAEELIELTLSKKKKLEQMIFLHTSLASHYKEKQALELAATHYLRSAIFYHNQNSTQPNQHNRFVAISFYNAGLCYEEIGSTDNSATCYKKSLYFFEQIPQNYSKFGAYYSQIKKLRTWFLQFASKKAEAIRANNLLIAVLQSGRVIEDDEYEMNQALQIEKMLKH